MLQLYTLYPIVSRLKYGTRIHGAAQATQSDIRSGTCADRGLITGDLKPEPSAFEAGWQTASPKAIRQIIQDDHIEYVSAFQCPT